MDLTYNLLNVAIFGLIVYGTAIHKNRQLHVRIMLAAFVFDLLLLMAVEFLGDQSAVRRAAKEVSDGSPPAILVIHIVFAATALLLWFVQIFQGRQIMKGDSTRLKSHSFWARIFLVCRFGNVATAFFL